MSLIAGLVLVLVPVLAIVGLGAVVASILPVTLARTERFVERTGVRLTEANASYVVDALARTRRWRGSLVLVAVSAWIAWCIVSASATFTTVTGVAISVAVLAGTVIGELRNASARADGPRSASLAPRVPSQYVGAWASTWPAILATLCAALLLVDVLLGHEPLMSAVFGAVGVMSWLVARQASQFVVDRPRPASTDPGVIAADDGLRSRALHAIGGTAAFSAGWAAVPLAALPLLGAEAEQTNSPIAVIAWLVMVAIAVTTWKTATEPFHVAAVARPSVVASEDGAAT